MESAEAEPLAWNGLLVLSSADTAQGVHSGTYRGMASGTPWPLGTDAQAAVWRDRELAEAMARYEWNWDYTRLGPGCPLRVVPDVPLVLRYVAECRTRGLGTRTLLCATCRRSPRLSRRMAARLVTNSVHLGWDYGYSSCTYSALDDDLHPPPCPELAAAAQRLNAFGLLDTQADLDGYVTARWDLIRATPSTELLVDGFIGLSTVLEDHGDFVAFLLHEVHLAVGG
ncbi:MAG TPA: hypothetical protein VGN26_08250 [Armatimonadota bacterium]